MPYPSPADFTQRVFKFLHRLRSAASSPLNPYSNSNQRIRHQLARDVTLDENERRTPIKVYVTRVGTSKQNGRKGRHTNSLCNPDHRFDLVHVPVEFKTSTGSSDRGQVAGYSSAFRPYGSRYQVAASVRETTISIYVFSPTRWCLWQRSDYGTRDKVLAEALAFLLSDDVRDNSLYRLLQNGIPLHNTTALEAISTAFFAALSRSSFRVRVDGPKSTCLYFTCVFSSSNVNLISIKRTRVYIQSIEAT